jgi:hypothetical protein
MASSWRCLSLMFSPSPRALSLTWYIRVQPPTPCLTPSLTPSLALSHHIGPRFIHVQVSRDTDFAAVKNAPGKGSKDSRDTARKAISDYHIRLATAAGATIQPSGECLCLCLCLCLCCLLIACKLVPCIHHDR